MRSIKSFSKDELEVFLKEYYYSEESVDSIFNKYEIKETPSRLKYVLPPLVTEFLCPYCVTPMYETAPSRTELKARSKIGNSDFGDIFCKDCEHKETKQYYGKYYCDCKSCTNEQQLTQNLEIQLQKEKFEKILQSQQENVITLLDIDNVVLKTYLLSLVLYLCDDNLSISTINSFSKSKFFPTIEFGQSFISTLRNISLIGFDDVESNLKHIHFLESEDNEDNEDELEESKLYYNYAPYDIQFRFLIDNIHEFSLPEIVSFCEDFPHGEQNRELALDLWREIAKSELLEYLYNLFEKYKFNQDAIGDSIKEKMELILEDFSVSEGYAIIYNAVNGAASYKQTGVSFRQAINSIGPSIVTNINKRKSGEWNTNSYKRNYELPQTPIAATFFDNILKIGEKGFTHKPTLDLIPLVGVDRDSIKRQIIHNGLRKTIEKLFKEELIDDNELREEYVRMSFSVLSDDHIDELAKKELGFINKCLYNLTKNEEVSK